MDYWKEPSLGDILGAVLAEKETKMRKKIAVYVEVNGADTRKISAIKLVREVFGIGLVEAKNFVEQNVGKNATVIINADQFAALAIRGAEGDKTFNDVYLSFHGAKFVDGGVDFSASIPY